eukprot:SAG11_NODE_2695_length_3081_cov_1.330315_2_plen_196_part_00
MLTDPVAPGTEFEPRHRRYLLKRHAREKRNAMSTKSMEPPPAKVPANATDAASNDSDSVDMATIEKMKVSDLRTTLHACGLSTDGKKPELVLRYIGHLVDATKTIRTSSESSRNKRKRPLEDPDASLVNEVRSYMKSNKLSQVMVGQEARVSQAVISQWLSLKYHGHNSKVSVSICLAKAPMLRSFQAESLTILP